jgi:hypothetical protein
MAERVQLDLSVEQARMLKDAVFNQAEQDAGQRLKLLALHEEIAGALSRLAVRGADQT